MVVIISPNMYSSPVQVGSDEDWSAVTGGSPTNSSSSAHSLAIKTSGKLYSWGYGPQGQLGQGTTVTGTESPLQVGIDEDWSAVACGSAHSLAIKTSGKLYSWGDNEFGKLGQGTTTSGDENFSPVQVGLLEDWSEISLGNDYSASIKTDGTLWAWGNNDNGQLGLGDTTPYSSPVQVGSDENWSSVDAGSYDSDGHTLAIKTNGKLYAWGYNAYGQLGLGDRDHRSVPTQVGTDEDWSSVSAGERHTLAIKTDGTLWTWGYNSNGQLGQENLTRYSSPVQVGSETEWLDAISIGNSSYGFKRG